MHPPVLLTEPYNININPSLLPRLQQEMATVIFYYNSHAIITGPKRYAHLVLKAA